MRRLLVFVIICAWGGIVVVVSSVVTGITVALNTGSGVLLVFNSSIGVIELFIFEFTVFDTANIETDMSQYISASLSLSTGSIDIPSSDPLPAIVIVAKTIPVDVDVLDTHTAV